MSRRTDHRPLRGSERKRRSDASLVGPADAHEQATITVILRRRTDTGPIPDFAELSRLSPASRQYLSAEVFGSQYGAAPDDLAKVISFASSNGLNLVESDARSRRVLLSGTVAQLETAFNITLNHYEGSARNLARSHADAKRTYRSYEGPIHVPAELTGVVVGVFGLDNRIITKANGLGDPNVTTPLDVPTVMQFYNFPTNSALGQTVGILSTGGYLKSDIDMYFRGVTEPTLQPFSADGTTNATLSGGEPDLETTQDICIAGAVAPQATIAVYFNNGQESGWLAVLNKATFPMPGEPTPSVLSSSVYICDGDDSGTLQAEGTATAFLDALSLAFQDAAGQGLTVCIASGDQGTDSKVGSQTGIDIFHQFKPPFTADNQVHVQYPGSDPWVLSCGGTTIGKDSSGSSSYDEYVWNDLAPTVGPDPQTIWWATGGGVSAYFAQPAWQSTANVPKSKTDQHIGRGVPDVAGNASFNSGYNITLSGNPETAGGTSAVAPLYAGLIALINAALGTKVGFINPLLYALQGAVCRSVDVSQGPPDNGINGIPGYPAGAGWNACTGWGSINGGALLAALKSPQVFQKTCTFVVDRSTYGMDEVNGLLQLSPGKALINPALWIVLDGFKPTDLNINSLSNDPNFQFPPTPAQLQLWAPAITATQNSNPVPASFQFLPVAVSSDDPLLSPTVQRFTFTYEAQFTDVSVFSALQPGEQSTVDLAATVQGTTANATILLVNEPDVFITNGRTSWLSIDLRVFSALQGATRFSATLNDPNTYITAVLANLTAGKGVTTTGTGVTQVVDSFEMLPVDEEPNIFVYPTTLVGGNQVPVFNFAIARVRFRGLSADATNVRVFFRAFAAQTTDSSYDQNATSAPPAAYRRAINHETVPQPIPLLGVKHTPQEYVTVPFFASQRIDATTVTNHDMSWQTDDPNVWPVIKHDPTGAEVDTFFGCWLDLNQMVPKIPPAPPAGNLDGPWDPSILVPVQKMITRNPHQCVVAEIVLDDSPSVIPPGATPSTSDKLAQRNLAWSDLP